jgi:signal transduction histidine kinase
MRIGKRIVGALTFSSTRRDRRYTTSDVRLAEELARRAAFAIENAQLYMETQKALAHRDEFISVASHELKTPVTSLKMYTQGLQREFGRKGDYAMAARFSRMDGQINKLTMLISDLLNISRIQMGKLEFNMLAFDLNSLVRETVENVESLAGKHEIIVRGKVGKMVWGDKDRIGQVLTNLLTNAIKYSPDAERVVVRLSSDRNSAVLRVKDFGIGIDKEHQEKVFNRFYRVNDSHEKTFPGLGIGLYISRDIIERHKGEIGVVSDKGEGSEFWFRLPYEENSELRI